MSAISTSPGSAGASVRRPGVVTATIAIVVAAALAAIANGVIIATGGKELAKQLIENAAGIPISDADLESLVQLIGYDSLDAFVDAFTMRGYLVGGAGVLLLLFGALMTKAATWARVMATISAVLVVVFSVVVLADETTAAMAGLAMAAILGGILSVIFTWLPANGRYATALRRA